MLETEMKKLTAALEANTNALLDNATLANTGPRPVSAPMEPVPNVSAPAAATVTTPVVTVAAPAAAIVAPVTPSVPSPSEITKDQVLQELSAVIQKMGDNGVGVTTLLTTSFGVTNLTALDPAQYGSVIAAAQALVV